MSRRAERVIALRDGTVYDSVSDAAKAVGCSTGAIYKSIQKRVTIKGTQWAWVDEDTSIRRKKITLGDIPSEEEQRMLLYHFLRIRARARRCYRKHHGHLGKSTLSEACYKVHTLGSGVAYAWTGVLLVIALRELHDYEFHQVFVNIVLALFLMIIIIFVCSIIAMFWDRVLEMVTSIVKEVKYRVGL